MHIHLLLHVPNQTPACYEIPYLKQIYEENRNADFELLTISLDRNLERLKRFVRKNNIPYPVLFDKDTIVAHLYGIRGIPAHFVIDKDGYFYFFGPDINKALLKIKEILSRSA